MDKPRFVGLEFTGDRKIGNQIKVDLDEPDSFIEIPLYKDEEREPINPDDVIRARMEEVWYK